MSSQGKHSSFTAYHPRLASGHAGTVARTASWQLRHGTSPSKAASVQGYLYPSANSFPWAGPESANALAGGAAGNGGAPLPLVHAEQERAALPSSGHVVHPLQTPSDLHSPQTGAASQATNLLQTNAPDPFWPHEDAPQNNTPHKAEHSIGQTDSFFLPYENSWQTTMPHIAERSVTAIWLVQQNSAGMLYGQTLEAWQRQLSTSTAHRVPLWADPASMEHLPGSGHLRQGAGPASHAAVQVQPYLRESEHADGGTSRHGGSQKRVQQETLGSPELFTATTGDLGQALDRLQMQNKFFPKAVTRPPLRPRRLAYNESSRSSGSVSEASSGDDL